MRISDWSSDVCSSDLLAANDERVNAAWPGYEAALEAADVQYTLYQPAGTQHGFNNDTTPRYDEDAAAEAWKRTLALFDRRLRGKHDDGNRSEEHPSELQSLMRISYAVFCLKKKKKTQKTHNNQHEDTTT